MSKNGITTQADNPGIIARPPLLYGAALIVVFVLRWSWPMTILDHKVAVWLGVPLVVLGVVLREELYLDHKFGDTYRQYRSKVRRYL